MTKIHIGPHRRRDKDADPHPTAHTFDREINLRGIGWTVGLLLATALVAHLLVWGMIAGFNRFDDRREPKPSPVPEANEQPLPPLPRLEIHAMGDLMRHREEEDRLLGGAAWIDRQQGRVRIPIDLAMEIVAGRGLGAEVSGGSPGAAPAAPAQVPGPGHNPADESQAGALIQMSRQPGQSGTVRPSPAGTPPPPERR